MSTNDFISKNLLTYLGNKRKLIPHIEQEIRLIKQTLQKETISSFDGFMGSGVVSRMLKYHSHTLYANDLELYSFIINSCFLSQPSQQMIEEINTSINQLNTMEYTHESIISTHYSPQNTNNIHKHERVFYTHENAMIIDSMRQTIESLPDLIQPYLLAPLLIKASIHTNTSGVFKGFHKKNGIGHFGGKNEDNTDSRILKKITLDKPIFSDQPHVCDVKLFNQDINTLISSIPHTDITYLDPPYNQHPYGSNYFMLNTIITNTIDESAISKVSGIPKDWNKSKYNYKKSAFISMKELIQNLKTSYIILSYNNEGILSFDEIKQIIEELHYTFEVRTIEYDTYKGGKNLKNRPLKVDEYLWIICTHL